MSLLDQTVQDGVARIEMRGPRLNALSDAMLEALDDAIAALAGREDIRVVILAGGPRAFCPGHDLNEVNAKSPEALTELFARCSALMLSLAALPQPVIAEVAGVAVAAGCQLVASCDLAVAAETARFGVNGIDVGLFCATPMVALTRAIPPRAAFELLTTGRLIDAAEAQSLGLVTRIAAEDHLARDTMALARTIAAKDPVAIRLGKRAFRAQAGLPAAEAYALTCDTMVENMAEPATREAIGRFLDRRRSPLGLSGNTSGGAQRGAEPPTH